MKLTGGPANPEGPAGPTSPRSPCRQQAVHHKVYTVQRGCIHSQGLHVNRWVNVVKLAMSAKATYRGSTRSSGSSRSEGTALTLGEKTVSVLLA